MTSNKNLFDAFKNAFSGIAYAIKTQANIKIQLAMVVIVMVAGAILKFSAIEFVFLTFACGLVLVTEMLNTSIEATVNLVTDKFHPIAKIAKDVGAGAVLIASLNALVVGLILFIGKII
ncbi:MAG: diacylglycerol kinase family protein [Clostridia bacterium]|nr:diacylglycerol kinase family protein [Clostridia bacterium]